MRSLKIKIHTFGLGLVLTCANLNGEGNVLELVETLARVEKTIT
jgi:hypothetical protein